MYLSLMRDTEKAIRILEEGQRKCRRCICTTRGPAFGSWSPQTAGNRSAGPGNRAAGRRFHCHVFSDGPGGNRGPKRKKVPARLGRHFLYAGRSLPLAPSHRAFGGDAVRFRHLALGMKGRRTPATALMGMVWR